MPKPREGEKYWVRHNGTVKTYSPHPKPQAYLGNTHQEVNKYNDQTLVELY